MDAETVRAICRLFDLGEPAGAASPVEGGLTHRMWRIATTRAAFAVKELNRDFENADYVGSCERAFVFEQAAYRAGLPMPRPVPVAASGRCLAELPSTGPRPMTVRAHAWVEGEPLDNSRVYPPGDAAQVAVILARIHALGMTADGARAGLRAFGEADWRAHLARADERGEEWAPLLRSLLPVLRELEAYVASACERSSGPTAGPARTCGFSPETWPSSSRGSSCGSTSTSGARWASGRGTTSIARPAPRRSTPTPGSCRASSARSMRGSPCCKPEPGASRNQPDERACDRAPCRTIAPPTPPPTAS
ncbi:MAG: phosphotransferase [Dehalococcoidia bacterium]|nr:phosphotransferase [Dehalococcoidia bacterium]